MIAPGNVGPPKVLVVVATDWLRWLEVLDDVMERFRTETEMYLSLEPVSVFVIVCDQVSLKEKSHSEIARELNGGNLSET